MKKLTLFYLESCPYCKRAMQYLDELLQSEEYQDIELHKIEESAEAELADSYDYYYVPTFYFKDKKIHEGACSEEDVKKVLDYVLAEN